jgi:hypothetical protein
MAAETPRKRAVRPVFLIYGVFALLISLALAGFTLRGDLFPTGAQPTPTPTVAPTETVIPTPTVTVTVGPGTPTATLGPATTATVGAALTPTPAAFAGVSSTIDNPLGLPTPVLAVIFAFTTLSGIASILKFTVDAVVAMARVVGRVTRRP